MPATTDHKALLESLNAIPWELDIASGCFTYVGPQALDIFGYPLEEWYAERFWHDHLHPEDRDEAISFCETSTMNQQDHDFEYRMMSKDGRAVWIRDLVQVKVENNIPVKLSGLMYDITKRKLAVKALNTLIESSAADDIEKYFRTCVKNVARAYGTRYAIIGLIDDQDCNQVKTQAVWANGELVDNFTYNLEGTPCRDILDCKQTIIPSNVCGLYPDDHLLADMEAESYFGSPLVDSKGNTLGLIAIIDDKPMTIEPWIESLLTRFAQRIAYEIERNSIEESLRRSQQSLELRISERTRELEQAMKEAESSNKAKSVFLSRMSHELRTPLNAILGFSQLLERDPQGLTEAQQDYVSETLEAGRHLLKLVDEVLDLSRIETGNLDLEMDEVQVSEVIHRSIGLIQPQAAARHLDIHENVSHQDFSVYADANRLKQVLVNLLSNAVKYNQDSGHITIDSEVIENQYLRISISDSGEGLTDDEIARLYTPFERLNVTDNVDGTGIGLVITKYLVEHMGGTLGVSCAKGEGCTFWVELPLANAAELRNSL